jgi:outer membrane protein OmpA-like peptidoglycan-associated protein
MKRSHLLGATAFAFALSTLAVMPAAKAMHQTPAAATMVPVANEPDSCRSVRGNLSCDRTHGLDEKASPDAWKTDREPYNKKQRWYAIGSAPVEPRKIILQGIRFDYDKSNIRADSIPILEKNVAELKSSKVVKIKVVGHTDAHGSDAYNQGLSERRAASVVNYFVGQGISSSRISSEGRGESEPIAPNTVDGKDNPEGRAKNRRIEILIWDR